MTQNFYLYVLEERSSGAQDCKQCIYRFLVIVSQLGVRMNRRLFGCVTYCKDYCHATAIDAYQLVCHCGCYCLQVVNKNGTNGKNGVHSLISSFFKNAHFTYRIMAHGVYIFAYSRKCGLLRRVECCQDNSFKCSLSFCCELHLFRGVTIAIGRE